MKRVLPLLLGAAALIAPQSACAASHGSAPARSGNCPYGTSYTNSQGNGDGCARANQNAVYQDKTWFADVAQSGQTLQRPTGWNVAGVDYPVGYDKTLSLKNPTVKGNLPAGCTMTGGTHWVCRADIQGDLTISGFDFSIGLVGGVSTPGAGTWVEVVLGTHNLTVTNNNFAKGPNTYQQPSIDVVGGTGNRTYTSNVFDGKFGTPPADNEEMVLDNATGGAATFEYNYCPGPQNSCLVGIFTNGVTAYYNTGPMALIGGVWDGQGTLSGRTFTVNNTTAGVPPMPGQKLFCTGSCTGFMGGILIDSGGPTTFTMHTAPGDGTYATMNSQAVHPVFIASISNVASTTLEDFEFNTVWIPSTAPTPSGTAPFEFNSGVTANTTLAKAVAVNNTLAMNRSGGVSGTYTVESAIFHDSLSYITELDVEDNWAAPTGALYCQDLARAVTSLTGSLGTGSNGYGLLTVTADSPDIIPAGGILTGSNVTSTSSSPKVEPYGTNGASGTGGAGTYAVSDNTQTVATISGGGVSASLGTFNYARNINMTDGSTITAAGPLLNAGTCNHHG